MGGYSHPIDPWRVRISVGKVIRGAGILLPDRQVLTCAHVVRQRGAERPAPEVLVEFVGMPTVSPLEATVAEGGWQPSFADRRGDLALLDLAGAVPAGRHAVLHQRSVRGRTVWVQGFPADTPDGAWVRAMIAGPTGPHDELMQLDPISTSGLRVERGFSGAGVLDEQTGQVLGMVVSAYADRDVSWMFPTETILDYLPGLAGEVTGTPPVDPAFQDRIDRLTEVGQAGELLRDVRELVDRLASAGATDVLNLVGDPPDRSVVLVVLVALADPRLRAALPVEMIAAVPADAVLPMRSIDLAVDAAGKTTEEVGRRIAERVGPPENGNARNGSGDALPPVTVVVDSVDQAADPESLLTEVLLPMADSRSTGRHARLVIGSRAALPTRSGATTLRLSGRGYSAPRSPDRPESLAGRLDRLDGLVDEVDAAETVARERFRAVASRIRGIPRPTERTPLLRLRATQLRAVGHSRPDEPRLSAGLAAVEHDVAEALRQARESLRRYDELLDRRARLRGLLDAYRARAVAGGFAEDIDLAARYEHAYRLLACGPCDLAAAEEAVHRYLPAVRQRLGTAVDRGEGAR
ncbi:S1 family peptidase [Gandjariella thermophila]|uniref:Serine protease n=1 Tax=Gandjariella thermophila TaxID=1931992 RepID=A0A4D4JFI2_9PSEU|nr:serine protease [Gandjariella thermophila]GDY32657.1 serine protease [Gandjariella thermophila]